VTNWTLTDRSRRVTLKVGVAYTSDPARVLDVLLAAAKTCPKVLDKPPVVALCTGFRDSALNFDLRAWTAAFEDSDRVLSDLAVAVRGALTEAKIEIAFPLHDIHIRDAGGEPLDLRKREQSG
jgi:potassium-dependent mechanosensitive channel